MYDIVYDIFSTLTASVLFTLMFIMLYAIERKSYLLLWGLSSLCFSALLGIRLFIELSRKDSSPPLLMLSLIFISSYFLLAGVMKFLSRKHIARMTEFLALLYSLIVVLYLNIENIEITAFLVFFTSAYIYCYSGFALFMHTRKFSIGGKVAGISMLAWGLHKAYYPFIRHVEWLNSVSYHIVFILILTTASGIMLMHFEKVKKDLNERERVFRSIAEVSGDIIFIVDYMPEMKLKYVNPSVEKVTGYSVAEIFYSEELQNTFFMNYLLRARTHSYKHSSTPARSNIHETTSKSGKELILEYSSTDYYGMDGTIEKTIGYITDVTKDVLAFDTLIDRQDWYEAIFQKSTSMQMLVNAETGFIADANRPFTELYKYGIEELRDMRMDNLFISRNEAVKFWNSDSDAERPYRYKTIDRYGNLKTVLIAKTKIIFGDTQYLYVSFTDLTSEAHFQKQLRNITTLHSAILDSLHEGVMGIDDSGNIFFVNSYAQKLLGYSDIELIGRNPHECIHHDSEDGHRGIEDCPLMHFISNGEDTCSYRDFMMSKSGRVFPIESYVSFLRYYDNEKKCILIFRDITEETATQAKMVSQIQENEVLLQEVHHRVKNNLQIICSLLSLQSESLEDQKQYNYLSDSIARIKSMSLIHELLYQTQGLDVLSIKDYLEKLTFDLKYMFAVNDDITLITDIENVAISLDKAVPSGLIITELFTNAVKHAFKDKKQEKIIEVGFKQYGESYKMWLKDNGNGLLPETSFNESKSLGLTVIRSLTKQLGGEIEFVNDNGLNICITYPIS